MTKPPVFTFRPAFTFIELTVVIAIIATLTTLATVNLLAVQHRASISAAANGLLADLRAQQLKAISGDTEGSGVVDSHGIFFDTDNYVLFRGSSYAANNPTNFSVDIEDPLTISSQFPSSAVIFQPGSGAVSAHNSNTDTIVITNPQTSESYTLELNSYGVVTQFN